MLYSKLAFLFGNYRVKRTKGTSCKIIEGCHGLLVSAKTLSIKLLQSTNTGSQGLGKKEVLPRITRELCGRNETLDDFYNALPHPFLLRLGHVIISDIHDTSELRPVNIVILLDELFLGTACSLGRNHFLGFFSTVASDFDASIAPMSSNSLLSR
jgi:hypothetical protein